MAVGEVDMKNEPHVQNLEFSIVVMLILPMSSSQWFLSDADDPI